jgi:hypothetical protein
MMTFLDVKRTNFQIPTLNFHIVAKTCIIERHVHELGSAHRTLFTNGLIESAVAQKNRFSGDSL